MFAVATIVASVITGLCFVLILALWKTSARWSVALTALGLIAGGVAVLASFLGMLAPLWKIVSGALLLLLVGCAFGLIFARVKIDPSAEPEEPVIRDMDAPIRVKDLVARVRKDEKSRRKVTAVEDEPQPDGVRVEDDSQPDGDQGEETPVSVSQKEGSEAEGSERGEPAVDGSEEGEPVAEGSEAENSEEGESAAEGSEEEESAAGAAQTAGAPTAGRQEDNQAESQPAGDQDRDRGAGDRATATSGEDVQVSGADTSAVEASREDSAHAQPQDSVKTEPEDSRDAQPAESGGDAVEDAAVSASAAVEGEGSEAAEDGDNSSRGAVNDSESRRADLGAAEHGDEARSPEDLERDSAGDYDVADKDVPDPRGVLDATDDSDVVEFASGGGQDEGEAAADGTPDVNEASTPSRETDFPLLGGSTAVSGKDGRSKKSFFGAFRPRD